MTTTTTTTTAFTDGSGRRRIIAHNTAAVDAVHDVGIGEAIGPKRPAKEPTPGSQPAPIAGTGLVSPDEQDGAPLFIDLDQDLVVLGSEPAPVASAPATSPFTAEDLEAETGWTVRTDSSGIHIRYTRLAGHPDLMHALTVAITIAVSAVAVWAALSVTAAASSSLSVVTVLAFMVIAVLLSVTVVVQARTK